MTDQSQSAETAADNWFSALMDSLYVIRVPLVMSIVTLAALTVPEQVQEVYRVLAQESTQTASHWGLALASLLALSVVLWQVAREFSYAYGRSEPEPHPVAEWILRWLPRVIATTPLLGAALGLWLSLSRDVVSSDPLLDPFVQVAQALKRDFYFGIAVCLLLAALVFAVTMMLERGMAPAGSNRARRVTTLSNWLLFPGISLAFVAFLVADQVRVPQYLGAVPIFAVWMVLLALIFALLTRFRLFSVPVLAILAIFLAAIEFFGLSDNHKLRVADKSPVPTRPSLDLAFYRWLDARKNLKTFQDANKPYPVYIVAAEGGGLYAAYQTAKFLTRMQDRCPSLAHHVFAISSVSGGSLGAAVFTAMAAEQADQPLQPCAEGAREAGPLEQRAHALLSKDLLSPILSAALFPDFLQRFIPWPIPALDRGRALDRAFERAWRGTGAVGTNPFRGNFFEVCGSSAEKCLTSAIPMLALNTTNVESGMQMVLSPMDLGGTGPNAGSRKIYDFFSLVEPFDMRLSTAVGLSARFPWISPPGWYAFDDPESKRPRRMSFVDGGYVDNSGVVTALGIAQHINALLSATSPRPNVEIKVVLISALWAPLDKMWIDPPQGHNYGEIIPPVDAAINARQGRGYTTQYDAALEERKAGGLSISEIGFYYSYLAPPLGWQLSEVSRRYIELFKGHPERCPLHDEDKYRDYTARTLESHEKAAVAYIRRADCVVARVANELTPSAPIITYPSINSAH